MSHAGLLHRVVAWRRRGESERGASLVLALAMIMIISVAIVATLAYAVTSLHTISVIKEQRQITYAAEGGVNTAIQAVRRSTTDGVDTGSGTPSCPAGTLNYTANGKAAAVTCQVVTARGPGVPGTNMPPYALQAVGTDGSESGISQSTGGSNQKKIVVGGDVASSSPAVANTYSINVINLQLNGFRAWANGDCTKSAIHVTDPTTDINCNTGQTYPDPGYPAQPLPSTSNAANFNPAPVCKQNNAAWEFSPGYYTDVDFLENPAAHAAAGSKNCAGVEWFAPGVYFLDLSIDPGKSDPVWNMDGTSGSKISTVIGGQPKGWNPDSGTPNTSAAETGFSRWCKTERDAATDGVQFVLGGNTQLVNQTAVVELCASPNPSGTSQQIAIYGQKSGGTTAPTSVTSTPSGAPTQAASPSPQFSNPTNAMVLEQDVTTPVLVASTQNFTGANGNAAKSTAALTLPGFAGVSVPAGAMNVTYDLQVSHDEGTNGKNNFDNNAGPTLQIGSCSLPLSPQNGLAVEHVAMTPAQLTCLQGAIASTWTATYQVAAANNKTLYASLDGVKLVVSYTPFVVRAQQGTVTAVGGDATLSVGGNNATFVVWGTVYTPFGKVVASFNNNSVFQFRRGVIARTIQNVSVPPADTASSFCSGYGINDPTDPNACKGPLRVLRFTATVGGQTRLVALVEVVDSPTIGANTRVWAWNVRKS